MTIYNFKKNKAIILTFIVALLSVASCKKDFNHEIRDQSSILQERTDAGPNVVNGMLYFESFTGLAAFTKSLESNEADLLQLQNAYASLGVDVNAETLPNLTDHPVCLLFERNTGGGYSSLRRLEEVAINTALDNGDDNVISIVSDPYWKTVLNADRAVKVGNQIYRFFENGGVVIVANNDWTTYNEIRSLAWENINAKFNIITTHRGSSDFEDYFTLDEAGKITSGKNIYKPRFAVQSAADGKLMISNLSCITPVSGLVSYLWTYSDNTTSTGINPDRTIMSNESVSVTVNTGDGNSQTLSPLACTVENFAITNLGNNLFKFGPGYDPGNSSYYTKWVFSDGTVVQATTTNKTFTSNGWVRCEAWRVIDNTLACQFTKDVIVKCGDKKIHTETYIFDQGNQRWKMDGSIWVQTGEVGCKVKCLRWRGAILGWQPAYHGGVCLNFGGTYIREVNNPNKNCIDVNAGGFQCYTEGVFPTTHTMAFSEVSTVFNKPGQLNAGLSIKVNGVWRGWGEAGKPKLVLP